MNIDILNKYCEDGWLMKNEHPTKDLIIWNYSRKTQYEKHWDEITLQCNALVTNKQGEIVSRCFNKIFNYGEIESEIPDEPFEVTEKMDGQLGFLFFYDNEWIFGSKGSFDSVYSRKGMTLLQKYDYKKLEHGYTYIFEIIFDEGRVVCKYDFEDIVLTACVHIKSGIEKTVHDPVFHSLGFRIVKKYDDVVDLKGLKSTIPPNAEGYVARSRSGLRFKIKGEEYDRLHYLITKFSSRDIWKYLKENRPLEALLEKVPDEFYGWVREKIDLFNESFRMTKRLCLLKYLSDIDPTYNLSRKEVAEKILKHDKSLHGIFFHIYDEKDYSHLIWDKIYPKYERAFNKNDEEGDTT